MYKKTILLTAWDDNRLIGNGSGLPWKIPRDLKLFQKRTKGHTIIFGLNTYNGLPRRPLEGRVNIVVTPEFLEIPSLARDTALIPACGVKNAIDISRFGYPKNKIFICGGASIYKQALEQDLVDEMLVSIIPGKHEGNVFFPEFPHVWDRRVIEEYNEFVVERWTKETK